MKTQIAWAERLDDNRAIAAYVVEHSPYDICAEQIEDEYIGCCAVLAWRAVDTLKPGNADGNQEDLKRQKACDARPVETMPPLLVDCGAVADGNHRLRTLLDKGITHFWVYDIQED